jgi:hypothetical protein
MLTGQRAFTGATSSDVIAAILEREPDFSLLPVATPPHIVRLLKRALDKDLKTRLRDIGNARADLDVRSTGDAPPAGHSASRFRERLAGAALALAAAAAAAFAVSSMRNPVA